MKHLSQASLEGKRVLLRVDFNVPLDESFNITDDSRIVAALPTIKKIISDKGKVIIMSHLGRPKNIFEEKFSLKHTVSHLSRLLQKNVTFSNDCIGEKTQSDVSKMLNGDVLLLENLRFYSEEKKGDTQFAKQLSELGDIYVNDAFGTAHRAHASTAIIADFFPEKKYSGYLLQKEIDSLKKVLESPKRPFTAIIGGAKITGKIDLIRSLFDKVNTLIIGGGMAYTFIKASGGSIGKSLVEDEKIELAKSLIEEAKIRGIRLLLPSDSVNSISFKNTEKITVSRINNIDANQIGLDIGPKSIADFSEEINNSKTIIWNGPMGVFEIECFSEGTRKIGVAICNATKKGAFSLIGGGDSVAAAKKFGLTDKVSYISTGGGAMLEYLEGKDLPGVIAIED